MEAVRARCSPARGRKICGEIYRPGYILARRVCRECMSSRARAQKNVYDNSAEESPAVVGADLCDVRNSTLQFAVVSRSIPDNSRDGARRKQPRAWEKIRSKVPRNTFKYPCPSISQVIPELHGARSKRCLAPEKKPAPSE